MYLTKYLGQYVSPNNCLIILEIYLKLVKRSACDFKFNNNLIFRKPLTEIILFGICMKTWRLSVRSGALPHKKKFYNNRSK